MLALFGHLTSKRFILTRMLHLIFTIRIFDMRHFIPLSFLRNKYDRLIGAFARKGVIYKREWKCCTGDTC